MAKESDINSFVFFFETAEKIVGQKMMLDAFGYPDDYLATYVDHLKRVAGEEVRAAAAEHLHLDRVVVLIIGDVNEQMRARLTEQIGPITEIGDEELRGEWL